jgi:hypothetical protein
MNAMKSTPLTENLIEPRSPHWVSRAAFPVLVAIFYLSEVALGVALYVGIDREPSYAWDLDRFSRGVSWTASKKPALE